MIGGSYAGFACGYVKWNSGLCNGCLSGLGVIAGIILHVYAIDGLRAGYTGVNAG